MRHPYYLIRRGKYWYYRLNRESGLVRSDGITWHTTGCKNRTDAENFVKDLLADSRYPDVPAKHLSFRKYAAPMLWKTEDLSPAFPPFFRKWLLDFFSSNPFSAQQNELVSLCCAVCKPRRHEVARHLKRTAPSRLRLGVSRLKTLPGRPYRKL